MKRAFAIVAIIAALIACYIVGRVSGIRHAIEDCEIWAIECYNPADPDASAWGEYDMRVFIDLDGNTYVHGLIQG